jgi:hypothetical protein
MFIQKWEVLSHNPGIYSSADLHLHMLNVLELCYYCLPHVYQFCWYTFRYIECFRWVYKIFLLKLNPFFVIDGFSDCQLQRGLTSVYCENFKTDCLPTSWSWVNKSKKNVLSGKNHYVAKQECGCIWIQYKRVSIQCAVTWAWHSLWIP